MQDGGRLRIAKIAGFAKTAGIVGIAGIEESGNEIMAVLTIPDLANCSSSRGGSVAGPVALGKIYRGIE